MQNFPILEKSMILEQVPAEMHTAVLASHPAPKGGFEWGQGVLQLALRIFGGVYGADCETSLFYGDNCFGDWLPGSFTVDL